MLLFELDILAIIALWIAVPLVTLRLVHAFRAAVPRWERRASVGMQWAVIIVIFLGIPILALLHFTLVADNVAGRAGRTGP
jgi:hypothetical protein